MYLEDRPTQNTHRNHHQALSPRSKALKVPPAAVNLKSFLCAFWVVALLGAPDSFSERGTPLKADLGFFLLDFSCFFFFFENAEKDELAAVLVLDLPATLVLSWRSDAII